MSTLKINFIKIVESAVANGVSDIHFRSGEKPCFRIKGGASKSCSKAASKQTVVVTL